MIVDLVLVEHGADRTPSICEAPWNMLEVHDEVMIRWGEGLMRGTVLMVMGCTEPSDEYAFLRAMNGGKPFRKVDSKVTYKKFYYEGDEEDETVGD